MLTPNLLLIISSLLWLTFSPSEARLVKRPTSAVVTGTVYCDTCFRGDLSSVNYFISGATVAVECGNGKSTLRFREEATTNKQGDFIVNIPLSMSTDVERIIEGCEVKLLTSGESHCAVASTARSSPSSIKLKSSNLGTHVFSAGVFTFKPVKQPALCNRKQRITKESNSMRTHFLPIQDYPKIPFLPPTDQGIFPTFPDLPPFPQLPPLPGLPGLPKLPPVRVNNQNDDQMKFHRIGYVNPSQPDFFYPPVFPSPPPAVTVPLPPNPLNPPPLVPSFPLQPPSPPSFRLPGTPGIPGLTPLLQPPPPPAFPIPPFTPVIPFPPRFPGFPRFPPATADATSAASTDIKIAP